MTTVLVWTDLAPRPGWQQMALDEAAIDIARDDDVTLLRLYRWDTNTVSFGAHEMATRTWNRHALKTAGIPVVRRPTGGRAVWHDSDDLTYSVAARLPPSTALRDFYRTTHEELALALDSLGLPTAMAPSLPRTPSLSAGACFEAAVGGEVLVAGTKAIGSAQLVRQGVMLQHGAIARRDPLIRLDAFLLNAPGRQGAGARDVLPEAPTIAAAIEGRWRVRGATTAPARLTQRVEAASVHYSPRYHDASWTWRR
ncbi:MAG: hypothetical protein ABIR59_12580 [Gemmatimonadales bacterium]